MRKRRKMLAFLLAGTLAMSGFTVANANEPEKNPASEAENLQDGVHENGGITETELTDVQLEEMEKEAAIKAKGDEKESKAAETDTQEGQKEKETTETDEQEKVKIPDADFRAALAEKGAESDENGFVNKADMERIMSIKISGKRGIDITGIQYASNVGSLTIENCGITSEWIEKYLDEIARTRINELRLPENQITDLSFIDRLDRMSVIDVSHNQISDFTKAFNYSHTCEFYYVDNTPEGMKQIFEKYNYEDISLPKGAMGNAKYAFEWILGTCVGFQDTESVEFTSSDEEVITVEGRALYAKKKGEAVITASYEGIDKTFKVTVTEDEYGEAIADEDKISVDEIPEEKGNFSVLKQGQIWNWETNPPKQISGDKQIKTYIPYGVFRRTEVNDGVAERGEDYYGIDRNGILWNFTKIKPDDKEFQHIKIADNVRFAIKCSNYGYKTPEIVYITEDDKCSMTYMDGENAVTQFVCDNAESVNHRGYVSKKDGTIVKVEVDDDRNMAVKEEKFKITAIHYSAIGDVLVQSYDLGLDENGNLLKRAVGSGVWDETPFATGVSELNLYGYVQNGVFYRFYRYEIQKVAEHVSKLTERGYITDDGVYYARTGGNLAYNQVLRGVKKSDEGYALTEDNQLYYIDEDGMSAIPLLSSVVDIFKDKVEEPDEYIFAQREDGSIWKAVDSEITKICTWSQMTETVLTDNGITVIGADEGIELKVKNESAISESLKTALENQVKSLHDNVKGMEIYDIALFKEGEEIHNLDASVRVTIPVPEGFGKNLVVYHEEQEGKLEDMKATVNDNGTVSFTASRFSPYILVDLGEKGGNTGGGTGGNTGNTGGETGGNTGNSGNGTGGNTGNSGGGTGGNTGVSGNGTNVSGSKAGGNTAGKAPRTGDASSMTLYLILALAALGSAGILGKRKLNK